MRYLHKDDDNECNKIDTYKKYVKTNICGKEDCIKINIFILYIIYFSIFFLLNNYDVSLSYCNFY